MAVTDLQYEKFTITDPRWKGSQPHSDEEWFDKVVPLPDENEIAELHTFLDAGPPQEERRIAFYREMRLGTAKSSFWKDYKAGKRKKIDEVLEWDPEFGLGNIIGIIIDENYAGDLLYALHAILSDKVDLDMAAWWEIPKLPTDENRNPEAQAWSLHQQDPERFEKELAPKHVKWMNYVRWYQERLDRGWNYAQFYHEIYTFGDQAMWVLHEVLGMDISEKDLHLGLLWKWS